MDFLRSKMEICLESHQACRRKSDESRGWLPRRLLKIEGTEGHIVYLRNSNELESQPYITLSHCWGKLKPTQLTAESEASLRAGIPASNLPKTFSDAIKVATQCGVQYIWIDSMCIRQDDLEDWAAEAATMCDVYSKAHCNIAATGASDGSVGLFFERGSTAECSFWVYADWTLRNNSDIDPQQAWSSPDRYPAGLYQVYPIDQWMNDVEDSPLNRRAWVMQERFLSTRILHFSASQTFWECLENTSGEAFPSDIPTAAQPYWWYDGQRELKRVAFRDERDEKWPVTFYTAWLNLASAYTVCGLTKEDDKLVAMNGVQQLLSSITKDTMICGLWRGNLIQELCWARSNTRRPLGSSPENFYPQKWRAPSWSWAGNNVAIHPGLIRHHLNCDKFQTKIDIEHIDVDSHRSGALKHASVRLRGKLVYATLIIDGEGTVDTNAEMVCRSLSASNQRSPGRFELILDNPHHDVPYREDLICLCIYACECDMFPTGGSLEALALRPHTVWKDQYERVGLVRIHDASYDFYTTNETESEHSLTIV